MLGILQFLATVIGLGLVVYRLHRDSAANRRTKAHETLNAMVSGDFVEILDELLIEFEWDVVAPNQPYASAAARVRAEGGDKAAVKMRARLVHLLRVLETISISCRKGLIDMDMCREYLHSIVINVHANASDFITDERARRHPEVFINVTRLAKDMAVP